MVRKCCDDCSPNCDVCDLNVFGDPENATIDITLQGWDNDFPCHTVDATTAAVLMNATHTLSFDSYTSGTNCPIYKATIHPGQSDYGVITLTIGSGPNPAAGCDGTKCTIDLEYQTEQGNTTMRRVYDYDSTNGWQSCFTGYTSPCDSGNGTIGTATLPPTVN